MNTKMLKFLSVAAVLLVFLSACISLPRRGSGRLIRETRPVSGFQAVELRGAGNLEIIQDGSESLLIETDDDVMAHVITEVRAGTLYVDFDFDDPVSLMPTEVNVTLHVRSLERIAASGAWEITCASLEADRLEIAISGAGSVRLDDLQADALTASLSGAGKIEIAGQVLSQQVEISGTGKYQAGDLQSETAVISLSGAGQAIVWVSDSLEVETSGAVSVDYYGHPQVTVSQAGPGNLRALGDK